MGLDAMVRMKLPYVVSDVDRHGNVRYYFRRRPDPKVRLPGRPFSPEFMEAYEAAKARETRIEPARAHRVKGTFAWACQGYYASAGYRRLDGSTKAWQRRALDAIAATDGEKSLAGLRPRHIRRMRDAKADTPAAANTMLKAIRALFAWACEQDFAEADPTKDVRRVRYVVKGHHSWSLDEVAQFEARWPIGTKQRLALGILLYSACRREDVTRMGPKHIARGRLRFIQAKNENLKPVDIDIPVHPELARIIAASPAGSDTFLVTEYGKPFSPAGFGNRFREWCDEAGLPHCSAHGVRKATAARLAESGATPHEIMAITGHQTIAEVERYTKAARKPGLADKGMGRLKKAESTAKNGGTKRAKSLVSNSEK